MNHMILVLGLGKDFSVAGAKRVGYSSYIRKRDRTISLKTRSNNGPWAFLNLYRVPYKGRHPMDVQSNIGKKTAYASC